MPMEACSSIQVGSQTTTNYSRVFASSMLKLMAGGLVRQSMMYKLLSSPEFLILK